MSRRRGWVYALMAPLRWLSEGFRLLVLVPYYETLRTLEQFGRWVVGGTGARSFVGVVIYYLLWLPLSIWHLTVATFRFLVAAAVSWPRRMQLRDLATGLPALVIAVPIILALTMLNRGRNDLTSMYIKGMDDSITKALKTKDSKVQSEEMKNALFYARSLVRIDPDDQWFRFHLARLYISAGDNARGMTMMNELAPRDRQGFAPAHFQMARQLRAAPWTKENYVLAESHLNRALKGDADKVDMNEVHRMLGEIYLGNYNATRKLGLNPLQISPAASMRLAKENFQKYQGQDPSVAYTLAGILVSEDSIATAKEVLEKVIRDLQQKLSFNSDDIPTRIELARAYSQITDFNEAANILQQGRNRSPDPRLDQALSNVLYTLSERTRVVSRSAPELAYNALEKAYALDPENTSVIARYVQAIFDDEAERTRAAKSLDALPKPARDRGVTKFLLAFEAERRNLPQRSDQLYREAATTADAETPGLIADVAQGAFEKRFPAITPDQADQLVNKAFRIWPSHPDVLFARASRQALANQYDSAAVSLQKAVDEREKNVTLKVRVAHDARLFGDLAIAYARVGQSANAELYRRKAESAAAKRDVLK